MKKVIAILIIAVLGLTLFSCKRKEELDEGVAELPADQQQSESKTPETNNVDETGETQQKTEEIDKAEVNVGDDGQSAGAKPTIEEPDYTTDMPFSEYEVVLTLNSQESAKDKSYTPADFPGLDIFNVFEYDYFPAEQHPDYADKTTLFLMLNEPSKQRVLEYMQLLKKDERVYDTCPNYMPPNFNSFYVTLTDTAINEKQEYSQEDFAYLPITSVNRLHPSSSTKDNEYLFNYNETYAIKLSSKKCENKQEYEQENILAYNYFRKVSADSRVCSVMPVYNHKITLNEVIVSLTNQQSEVKQNYTVEDFPQLYLSKVEILISYKPQEKNNIVLLLTLKNHGYEQVYSAIDILEKDSRVSSAVPNGTDIISN